MKAGDDIELVVPQLDGGLNNKDTPQNISVNESPDCLNVVFNDRGGVQTRNGSARFNTSTVETGSNVIDGGASFNGTMVVWAGGHMFRASATTFVTIPSAQSVFTPGNFVQAVVYQNQLMMSDGAVGPYRYTTDQGFYRLGISVPSAPTGISNVATVAGGGPETGTYYYKVAYRNTGVVDGVPGSASVAVVLTTTAVVYVSSIPTGQASMGVGARVVYRASTTTGTYRRVGLLSNNTTSALTDTMGATTWAAQTTAESDATAPTPWTTVKLHKERLWFDDSSDRTLVRYTEYGNPYVSKALDFIPLGKGDLGLITAIAVQDDFVTILKNTEGIWVVDMVDPSDDTSFVWVRSPSPYGIVGARAFAETENGLLFVGKQNGKITGVHLLTGIRVAETADTKLRTQSISERIETDLLAFPSAGWDEIVMQSFGNAMYMACRKSGDSANAHIYWLDLTRLGNEGQPGSWALWDGLPCKVSCLFAHDGKLYGGSNAADGYVIQLDVGSYNDAGAAINSYWWSKKLGGGDEIDQWVKDFRRVNTYHATPGNWPMNLKWRVDGDSGSGSSKAINLNPGGSLWGTMIWGTDPWGGGMEDKETISTLGTPKGRRIQVGFDNENSADQSFKVYKVSVLGNLRRRV